MIFINPWLYYLIRKPDELPNLTPQDIDPDEEMVSGLGAIIASCVSSLIFVILMYFTYKLQSNDIIDMDIMMLLFIVNVIIYVALIFAFMNLSFKITEKINKKKRR